MYITIHWICPIAVPWIHLLASLIILKISFKLPCIAPSKHVHVHMHKKDISFNKIKTPGQQRSASKQDNEMSVLFIWRNVSSPILY